MGLTPKQKKLLDYLVSFEKKRGYMPSQQEIAQHFGYSSLGTVQNYLVRLEQQGFLAKDWNARRGLRLVAPVAAEASAGPASLSHKTRIAASSTPTTSTPTSGSRSYPAASLDSSTTATLPLLGRVAAGRPIEAVETGYEEVEVPSSFLGKNGGTFVLKVVGDSMIGDGILEGDYLIVKKAKSAMNGQTVVALLNNEATVKRYHKKGHRVELHAANPKYAPIVVESLVDTDYFRVEGIVVGVLRHLS